MPEFDIPPKVITCKRTIFYSTPLDINWYEILEDFSSFANQLRYKAKQSQSTSIEASESKNNNMNNLFLSSLPSVRHARYTPLQNQTIRINFHRSK